MDRVRPNYSDLENYDWSLLFLSMRCAKDAWQIHRTSAPQLGVWTRYWGAPISKQLPTGGATCSLSWTILGNRSLYSFCPTFGSKNNNLSGCLAQFCSPRSHNNTLFRLN